MGARSAYSSSGDPWSVVAVAGDTHGEAPTIHVDILAFAAEYSSAAGYIPADPRGEILQTLISRATTSDERELPSATDGTLAPDQSRE